MKRWVLFTTYGWFIGILLVVGFALIGEVLSNTIGIPGGQAAVGIGMGAGVGLMQWLAARKYLTSSQKLFWFTFIGFSLAFILQDIVAITLDSVKPDVSVKVETMIPFTVLLGAFISGWLQYKFVFKKIIDKAVNWIFYSMASWLLATIITMGTPLLKFNMGENFPKVLIAIFAALFLTIGGPILGYITGRFIVTKVNGLNENDSTNAQQKNWQ
ncbi:MAG: hypothetical protein IT212_04200 [Bacteroidia bacterium]|nr:hypothetical protein [Bacteroidia bacterium]